MSNEAGEREVTVEYLSPMSLKQRLKQVEARYSETLRLLDESLDTRRVLQDRLAVVVSDRQAVEERLQRFETEKVRWIGARMKVREGWMRGGFDLSKLTLAEAEARDQLLRCTALGPPVFIGQEWLPVKWDDEEDPKFFKLAGLEREDGKML